MKATIYHNPRCRKSRETLEILQDNGIEPRIVEYLNTPLDRKALVSLLKKLKAAPEEIIRKKEAKDCGINLARLDKDKLIDKIVANPIVIERPIVVTTKGARICRPPETVEEIL